MSPKSLAELDWKPLLKQAFHPSPAAWEDRVLYFLLPDRFSDNSERDFLDVNGKAVQTGTTRRFDRQADFENAIQTVADAQRWRDAGGAWSGAT
jgi:hypothetical protein